MPRLPNILFRPRIWFAAYVCWFVVLFFLSEQSAVGPKTITFVGADKVAHAVYYAAGATGFGLGMLLWRPKFHRGSLLLVLLAISLAVGIFDEWHQTMTPGREGNSLGDIVADVVGGAIGFFVCQTLLKFAEGKRPVAELTA